MRRCIIHIGLHKTGTTAIQQTLAAKQADLERIGICYPVDDKLVRTQHQIAFDLIESYKLQSTDASAALLETALGRQDCEYLVISSEAFSRPGVPADRLAGFLERIKAAGWEIATLVYIRPQPSMLNSMYVQAVKTLREPKAFDDYAERSRAHMLDYAERLRPWTEQQDVEFVAVPYVSETTGPQIARRMLEAGGVPAEKLDQVDLTAPTGVNESLGSMAVAANRWLHRRDPGLRENRGGRLTRLAQAETARRGWSSDRFVALDVPRANKIWEEFAMRNAAFAERHFGRPWDEVFKAERERQWERNEVDIAALPSDLQRELDEFADKVIAEASGLPGSRSRARKLGLPEPDRPPRQPPPAKTEKKPQKRRPGRLRRVLRFLRLSR